MTSSIKPGLRRDSCAAVCGALRRTPELSGAIDVTGLVDTEGGLLFGTCNPQPPSLHDYPGTMAWYMDAMLGHYDEGTTVVGGVHKWVLEGNWKLAAEQFATDWSHVNMDHASALALPAPQSNPKNENVHRTGRRYADPNGHGTGFPVHPRNRFNAEIVHERTDYAALRARLGDARVEDPMTDGHATVFPNFSYLPVIGTIRVWHPKGPDRMEVWARTVVDKSMPEDVREAQRLDDLRTFFSGFTRLARSLGRRGTLGGTRKMTRLTAIRQFSRRVVMHVIHAGARCAYGGGLLYYHPQPMPTECLRHSDGDGGSIPLSNPTLYSRREIRREIAKLESWLAEHSNPSGHS